MKPKPRKRTENPDPRLLAAELLTRLEKSKFTLDRLLEDPMADHARLAGKDRALFQALVFGAVRHRRRLDWAVERHSKLPMYRIEPFVLNVLRMALFQMLFMDRVPVSAAVNTAAGLVKKRSAAHVTGFVNAVLRSASELQGKPLPRIEDPVERIGITESFPDWMVRRWIKRFGIGEAAALCNASNDIPPLTLRVNTLKTDASALLETLRPVARSAELSKYAPDAVRISSPASPVHRLPGFSEGWFSVQDESAQIVTLLLDPKPGENILDACAGLGGKTGHIAQRMNNSGRIIAIDSDPRKLVLHQEEMKRLGITIAQAFRHNLSTLLPLAAGRPNRYDGVLVDAPCSGMGVIRRNPDTKWSMRKEELQRMQERQVLFLENVADMVPKNGRIVYSVCSMEMEETTGVVEAFLARRSDFRVSPPSMDGLEADPDLFGEGGFFMPRPHRTGMDGFFAVRLVRVSDRPGRPAALPKPVVCGTRKMERPSEPRSDSNLTGAGRLGPRVYKKVPPSRKD